MNVWGVLIRLGVAVLAMLTLAAPGASGSSVSSASRGGGVLDGFAIGSVPRGVGGSSSDFTYDWEDVAFSSRIWERAMPDGGHEVELTAIVLRGERLTSPEALRDFLAAYHERPAETWAPVAVGPWPGFASEGQVFWLVDPGVAVDVRAARVPQGELMEFARSIRRSR